MVRVIQLYSHSTLSALCPMFYGESTDELDSVVEELNAPCHWGYKHYLGGSERKDVFCCNILKPLSGESVTEYADTILNHSFLSDSAELVKVKLRDRDPVVAGVIHKPKNSIMSNGFWTCANAMFRQEWEFKWLCDSFYRMLEYGVDRQTAMLLAPFNSGTSWDTYHVGHAAIYTNSASPVMYGAIYALGGKLLTTKVTDKSGKSILSCQTVSSSMESGFCSTVGGNGELRTSLKNFVKKDTYSKPRGGKLPYRYSQANRIDHEAFKDWCLSCYYAAIEGKELSA